MKKVAAAQERAAIAKEEATKRRRVADEQEHFALEQEAKAERATKAHHDAGVKKEHEEAKARELRKRQSKRRLNSVTAGTGGRVGAICRGSAGGGQAYPAGVRGSRSCVRSSFGQKKKNGRGKEIRRCYRGSGSQRGGRARMAWRWKERINERDRILGKVSNSGCTNLDAMRRSPKPKEGSILRRCWLTTIQSSQGGDGYSELSTWCASPDVQEKKTGFRTQTASPDAQLGMREVLSGGHSYSLWCKKKFRTIGHPVSWPQHRFAAFPAVRRWRPSQSMSLSRRQCASLAAGRRRLSQCLGRLSRSRRPSSTARRSPDSSPRRGV